MAGLTVLWWGLVTATAAAAATTAAHHIATDICMVTTPQLAIEVEGVGESFVLRGIAAWPLPAAPTATSSGAGKTALAAPTSCAGAHALHGELLGMGHPTAHTAHGQAGVRGSELRRPRGKGQEGVPPRVSAHRQCLQLRHD